jgi:TonB family protein
VSLALAACSPKQSQVEPVTPELRSEESHDDSLMRAIVPPMEVIKVDSGGYDVPPMLLELGAPTYPPEHKKKGLSGTVSICVLIDHKGIVRHVTVTQSDLPRIFELYAMQAGMNFKFKPGTRAGKVVNSRVCLPVQFRPKKND